MSPAPRFVSEPIKPTSVPISPTALAAGAPSLPEGFAWRGRDYRITDVLEEQKVMKEETFSGETYLRRHRYRLRMDDGSTWAVYFTRQSGVSRARQKKAARWFLQTIEEAGDADAS